MGRRNNDVSQFYLFLTLIEVLADSFLVFGDNNSQIESLGGPNDSISNYFCIQTCSYHCFEKIKSVHNALYICVLCSAKKYSHIFSKTKYFLKSHVSGFI